jgi:membrane protease YdiL (CAAX protease family)
MSFLAAAGLTIGARLVLDLLRELAEAARPGAVGDIVTYGGAFAVAHLVFVFLVLRVYAPESSLREVLGLRRTSPALYVLAPLAGAAMYPPLARLDALVGHRFPTTPEEQELADKLVDTSTHSSRIGLFIVLVLVVPIVAELFFRGALFGRLRRERTEGVAVFAASAYFVLESFDPRSMASLLVLGAVLTFVRARAGSTIPAILVHVAFFAVPLLPVLRGGPLVDDGTWSRAWVAGGAIVAALALAVSLVLASRSDRCEAARAVDRG